MPRPGSVAIGDHSTPPLAPGNMRAALGSSAGVGDGSTHLSFCDTIGSEKRIRLQSLRSCTYTYPVLPACITAGIMAPDLSAAWTSTVGLTASRSHTSCETYWKWQTYLPVSRSTETSESV